MTAELTKRETEIALLLADGFTNRRIAKELFLSEHTVKTYLKSMYEKLGVNCRAAAVAQTSGIRKGLV